MAAGNLIVNQGTNQGILVDQAGTSDIGVVKIDLSSAGTYGTLWGGGVSGTILSGSIVMTNGTLAALPNLPQGSIQVTAGTIASVGTIGTLGLGTITGNVGVSSGTINVGTVTLGTIPGIGSISSLGSLGMLTAGTVSMINAGTLTSSGTTTGVGSVSSLGSLGMLNAGTISMINAGTITSVGTLPGVGIVTNIGTLQGGTINMGTVAVTKGTISAGTIFENFAGAAALTITLASLATSGSVGRISSYVDNSTNRYQSAMIYVKVTIGSTAPTVNTLISAYLARSDNAGTVNDDGNGTVDAVGTFINTPLVGNILVASVGTNTTYNGIFDTSPLGALGPAWGIGILNNSGGSLHPTTGSQAINWVGRGQGFN